MPEKRSLRDSIENYVDFVGTVSKVRSGEELSYTTSLLLTRPPLCSSQVTKDKSITTVFFRDDSGMLVKLCRYYDHDSVISTRKQWRLFEASAGSTWRLRDLLLEGYDSFMGLPTVVWRQCSELVEMKGTKRALPSSANGRKTLKR